VTAALLAEDGERICGWKIGFLYAPRQPPMICPLFASRTFSSPAAVPLALTPSLRIEPEVSFILLADLPARTRAYRPDEVAEVLAACPSLEIVDTRFDTRVRSIRQMLDDKSGRLEAMADHNTTGAYITGKPVAAWQQLDFASMHAVMHQGGRKLVETVGGHAFTDPFLPCVVLANLMRHQDGLKAGQLLVTGSFSGFFEAVPDLPVTAEFDGLGSAQATFTTC
jgi:2-keto-4-pentenoate hydratase